MTTGKESIPSATPAPLASPGAHVDVQRPAETTHRGPQTAVIGAGAPEHKVLKADEVEPREALMSFAQDYEPGQRVEMMGGFIHWASFVQNPAWTHGTRSEWIERYEAFRTRVV